MSYIFFSQNDHYLDDFILPKGDSNTIVFPEYFDLESEKVFDLAINLVKNNEVKSTVPKSFFQGLRDTYIKQIIKAGFSNLNLSEIFFGFPLNASLSDELLGAYMYNLPFCKFLQQSLNNDQIYELHLNGHSIHNELNTLSSILKENLDFPDVKLVFEVINTPNKLTLLSVENNSVVINRSNPEWINLVRSAYTQLFLVMSIEHAVWHLVVAHIIHIAKSSLCFTEIKKVFDMASNNVFVKALEVKILLFGTPLVFQQTLNNNPRFTSYIKERVGYLIYNFNIDTVYKDYFNIGLRGLSESIDWIPGMKSNIEIIKKFVEKVISKHSLDYENFRLRKFIEKTYTKQHIASNLSIKKLLEILFVVGTAFHSTTFEFTKLIFTDVFYNSKLTKSLYNIGIQTIVSHNSVVFGDMVLYSGNAYLDEVTWLNKALEENRLKLAAEFESNIIFKNNIFSTKDSMNKYIVTNTYTTYV